MLIKILLLLAGGIQMVDVAEQSGLDFQHVSGSKDKSALLDTMSGGVAWLDYDGDGHLDLYFVNGGRWEDLKSGRRSGSNALFRGNGDGTFANVTEKAGAAGPRWGMGVTVADYDNDGDPDIYLSNYGPNTLLRNNGDGTFSDLTSIARVGGEAWSSAAAFADYDGDSHLDLYVANYVAFDFESSHNRDCSYRALKVHCGPKGMQGAPDVLYRSNGDGTFSDATSNAGVAAPASFGLGVLWGDYDGDGDQDIYVANDSRANYLFQNRGDGSFEEVGLLAGVAMSEDGNAQAGMGVALGDYDRDGDLDLFVTNFSDDYNTLYRNMGQGTFRDVSYSAQVGFSSRQYLGWGTHFADLDNDGWPDLFVANGHVYPQVEDFEIGTSYRQGKLAYRNRGDGTFEDVSGKWGADLNKPSASRGAAFADYDQDGDIDIAVNNLDGRPQLFRNEGGDSRGNWISIKLRGVRSNRDAIGARVTLVSPGGRQLQEVQSGLSFQSSNDLRLHFGLGKDESVSELRVRWPSGEVQSFADLKAGVRYLLEEGGKPTPEPAEAPSHRKP